MITIAIYATGETPKTRDNARGHSFEAMMAELFQHLGHKIRQLNAARSGGEVDILCQSLIGSVPCVSECKAHNRPVAVQDLKKFRSTYEDYRREDPATIGIFVSLGGFVPQAFEYYRNEIQPHFAHFELWDGNRVYELLVAAKLVSTLQEIQALTADRTRLVPGEPCLIYAKSTFFWAVPLRVDEEKTFRKFLLTDSTGILLRDLSLRRDLEPFVANEVLSGMTCNNDAFPEPTRRALLTEAGRYYGLRGEYQFPSQKTLLAILEQKRPPLFDSISDFKRKFQDILEEQSDLHLWSVHSEETERLLDSMIPDEVKEDLFPTEVFLLLLGTLSHSYADPFDFNSKGSGVKYHKRLSRLRSELLTTHLNALLDSLLERMKQPFRRTGQIELIGLDKVDFDFLTACLKLSCALDMAFFREPFAVCRQMERNQSFARSVIQSFQASGVLLDYNDHRISVQVNCQSPEAHLAILALADWVQSILDEVEPILYQRGIRFLRIDTRISRRGYEMVGCRFELHTESVIQLLMGRALYGTEDVAVRELLQNALDAVATQRALVGNTFEPMLRFTLQSKHGDSYLTVEDNGCGMDKYIVQRYLATVGKSFWRSEDFAALVKVEKVSPVLIGQFGIGILSVFMIGDQVSIETKMENREAVEIGIPGVRDFFVVRSSERKNRGTTISIRLKKNFDLASAIEKYLVRPACKVELVQKGKSSFLEIDHAKLWKRLGAPSDLDEKDKYFDLIVDINGLGFGGQILVLLPGNGAKTQSDPLKSLRRIIKQTASSSSSEYSTQNHTAWQIKGKFALLQAGVLVKESIVKESHYGGPYVEDVTGIKPTWVSNCAGFLDFRPGLLELTASRNDIVGGELPEEVLRAISEARFEILPALTQRCDELWSLSNPTSNSDRILVNTTLLAFNSKEFAADSRWKQLLTKRYSIPSIELRKGEARTILRTADELGAMSQQLSVLVMAIGENLLGRMTDVLVHQNDKNVLFAVPDELGRLALQSIKHERLDWNSVYDEIKLSEQHGVLDTLIPGYCGVFSFSRPTFEGVVLRWSIYWLKTIERSQAANISRHDFLRDAKTSKAMLNRLPKVMFNGDHPVLRLCSAILNRQADEESKAVVRQFLRTSIALVEAPSANQRIALLDECREALQRLKQLAKAQGVVSIGSKLIVDETDFVRRD